VAIQSLGFAIKNVSDADRAMRNHITQSNIACAALVRSRSSELASRTRRAKEEACKRVQQAELIAAAKYGAVVDVLCSLKFDATFVNELLRHGGIQRDTRRPNERTAERASVMARVLDLIWTTLVRPPVVAAVATAVASHADERLPYDDVLLAELSDKEPSVRRGSAPEPACTVCLRSSSHHATSAQALRIDVEPTHAEGKSQPNEVAARTRAHWQIQR
jgi:hypothetical protein